MREGKTGVATRKILATQKSAMGWTLFLSNLLALALGLGCLALYYMRLYAGSWAALGELDVTDFWLHVASFDPLQFKLTLGAVGQRVQSYDVTEPLAVFFAAYVGFLVVQGLISAISGAIWRGRVRQHLRRLTSIAEEARRLGQEAAAPKKVAHLQEAIGHIQPTEAERLHVADPDLKGLENAINDLLDRMQAAYSQQSRFVSDASHELRTPIAVLKGYADLLERWGKDDPQVRDEAIAAIQTEAGRMSRLVEQLLFLARGDSGRTKLNPSSLDLTDLTREVFEESKMIDPDHVWLLEAAEPIAYTADRDMLKQAMRILADNAAKYTPTGGEIQLRAARGEKGEVRIAVQDTGMGIRAEDAPHVFQRFYRADPARSRQSGGAGLGLSIASWILSQHGGFLEVYSWEGVGSRFTMVLPKENV